MWFFEANGWAVGDYGFAENGEVPPTTTRKPNTRKSKGKGGKGKKAATTKQRPKPTVGKKGKGKKVKG